VRPSHMEETMKHLAVVYNWIRKNTIISVTIIIFIIMLLFVPQFATITNIRNIMLQMSYVGIAAVGLSYVLIGGGNDLSIGTGITFCGIVGGIAMTGILAPTLGAPLGIAIMIGMGLLIGLLNGTMVAGIGVNAFVMTLITQTLFKGLSLLFTNSATLRGLPEGFLMISDTLIVGIPLPFILLLVLFIGGQFVLSKTTYGRALYVVGSNPKAAKLIGISVKGVFLISYVFCGVCTAVSSIILTSRLSASSPSAGNDLFLDILSAAVIGGNSLFGGKGSVIGTAFGVLLMALIANALTLLGVGYQVTRIIKGAIILFAVVLDVINEKLSAKRMLTFSSEHDFTDAAAKSSI